MGVPKGPAFNEKDVSDKPEYVQANDQLSGKKIRALNVDYRNRLRQLVTVNGFVKRAVRGFAKAGELDNTYIIFLSDNGYLMGQHRLMYKRHAYTESSSFPLIVRGPGVAKRKTDERVVANIDLAPTVLDIANAREPRWIDGESFKPILNNPSRTFRESVLIEDYANKSSESYVDAYRAIRAPDRLYTEYSTGENELYDLEEDPHQLENIYGERPEEQERLAARLEELKDCAGQSCRRDGN